jgi:hypothetical protein
MATLTELQKQGIYNLLQDWPIGDAIDYDRVQPISTYEPPEGLPQREKNLLGNENLKGFVHGVGVGNEAPPGNPFGFGKEYGADAGIYVRNIDQFQPEWTPGATEEGRVNRDLADVVGHEGRHIYFENNPELLEDLNVTALGNNVNIASEEYNRWLDGRLSESDLYRNNVLRHYMMMDRPGQGRLGTEGIANIFKKAESKFRKHRVDDRNQKFLEELRNRRAGPQTPAARPTPTYVSPARPHGDDRGSMPTGTAGRNPWGRADGGRIGYQEGGWHPGVGRDERGYQSTHPSYGGNGGGGENNQIAPVKKINISPVVETKYNRDLNLSYPSGKVGLKALTKLGKIQAMLDFKDLLEGEDLESEITYENQLGPTFIGGKFDTEGNKELGLGFNKGNLSIGAYTDLDDINQIGLRYGTTFKDGGLATMFERRR